MEQNQSPFIKIGKLDLFGEPFAKAVPLPVQPKPPLPPPATPPQPKPKIDVFGNDEEEEEMPEWLKQSHEHERALHEKWANEDEERHQKIQGIQSTRRDGKRPSLFTRMMDAGVRAVASHVSANTVKESRDRQLNELREHRSKFQSAAAPKPSASTTPQVPPLPKPPKVPTTPAPTTPKPPSVPKPSVPKPPAVPPRFNV